MVIALPTGIKIFSWLSNPFSKDYSTSRVINRNRQKDKSVYEIFPRSNRKYIPEDKINNKQVIYGSNLTPTYHLPKYTSIIKYIVSIPPQMEGIFVGIIISTDGWQQINKTGSTRQVFKQSMKNIEYFQYVFNKISHYCSSPPFIIKTNQNGQFIRDEEIKSNKTYSAIQLSTRSFPCLTKFYQEFYKQGGKEKIVPVTLWDSLTYESQAHWICCDGTYKSGIILQTDSFSIKEVVFIINIFIIKWNQICNIHYHRGNPVIYITSKSVQSLIPFQIPFIVPSMRYKQGIG